MPKRARPPPAQPEKLPQRHRQHRDVHRVGRGVLVELLQLQQRQHHRLARRAWRSRASGPRRRPRAAGCDLPASPPGASSPPRPAPRAASSPAWRRGAAPPAPARGPSRPAATRPNRMPSGPSCQSRRGRRRRGRGWRRAWPRNRANWSSRDRARDLQPLDPALREAGAPLPALELGHQVAAEEHLVRQEGERSGAGRSRWRSASWR